MIRAWFQWFFLLLGDLIFVVAFCFGPCVKAAPDHPSLEKIPLEVGETLTLRFPGDLGLRASKKGIIHPYSLGQGLWQITGLKTGIVILEYQAGAQGPRYLVEVKQGHEEEQKTAQLLPAWICRAKGISCDEELLEISGTAFDFNLWLRFRLFCRKLAGCQFKVALTAEQNEAWKRQLAFQLGKNIEVKGSFHEGFLVLGDCRGSGSDKLVKYVNDQTGQLQKDGLLVVRCLEDHYRDLYQVEIQMIRVEKGDHQSLPMIPSSVLSPTPTSLATSLMEKMDRLVESHRARVVAHPVVQVMTGAVTKVISGGEFAVESPKKRLKSGSSSNEEGSVVEWKPTGLELQIELFPRSSGRVSLKYLSEIKMRTADQSLSVQMLSGEVELGFGEKVLLGKIDFDHESYREKGGLLSWLPLVGSLFKETFEQEGRSEVYLWANLLPAAGRIEHAR